MTAAMYSAVNGPQPHPEELSDVEAIDRAIAANVAFAREAALLGDADGERIYHEAINKLLTIRDRLANT
ncbi:hypothetical protein TUSST3_09850 [Streptomyces sp. TUS-ST3]|uniref:hypothetical protein n=1 Tax=Streptomyces sp. TUS-ST3 TaxID=3025591 RepID=UPI0024E103AB|nr:hypothetical protein [Streptomyces sp. TUS-ST3]GLP64365.1 hypothetical protein TUSST3_09850 [Streptomyces sp. TUS-ST3]